MPILGSDCAVACNFHHIAFSDIPGLRTVNRRHCTSRSAQGPRQRQAIKAPADPTTTAAKRYTSEWAVGSAIGTTTEATTGVIDQFRGSDRGWVGAALQARCWPQPRTGRLTRYTATVTVAENGARHTRPAGQQRLSPPVTARPMLSIHPNRPGRSGLDRAIADWTCLARRRKLPRSRQGMCDSASVGQPKSEVKWRGQSRSRRVWFQRWRSWSSAACSARPGCRTTTGPTATVV